jgi:alkylated DNA repair dioxygenase AlkB
MRSIIRTDQLTFNDIFDDQPEPTLWQPPHDRLVLLKGSLDEAPGLCYFPEFISRRDEEMLLVATSDGAWSSHWSRRTQFFGARYTPIERPDEPDRPMPQWADLLLRVGVERGLFDRLPNQMGINEYLPGQGIAAHVDYFGGSVASLTLGGGCVMDITRSELSLRVSLWLAPRSIVLLTGPARTVWKHGIARRLSDEVLGRSVRRLRRVSITLRDVPAE